MDSSNLIQEPPELIQPQKNLFLAHISIYYYSLNKDFIRLVLASDKDEAAEKVWKWVKEGNLSSDGGNCSVLITETIT